jgi:hypothetical protein
MNKNTRNSQKTLDTQHLIKHQEFQKRNEKKSQLDKKLLTIDKLIDNMKNKKNTEDFDKYFNLLKEKQDIQKKIADIDSQMSEIEYYTETGNLLFQYYDIIENGAGSEENNNIVLKKNSILKFFVSQNTNTPPKENCRDDKASLLDKYLECTDKNYIKGNTVEKDICKYCNRTDLNMMLNEGIISCNTCSCVEYIIVDHDRPSYKDPPKEVTYLNLIAEYNSRLKVCFLLVPPLKRCLFSLARYHSYIIKL